MYHEMREACTPASPLIDSPITSPCMNSDPDPTASEHLTSGSNLTSRQTTLTPQPHLTPENVVCEDQKPCKVRPNQITHL